MGVLWGAAVRPGEAEHPREFRSQRCGSALGVLVAQTAVPAQRGLLGFPVSYQQYKLLIDRGVYRGRPCPEDFRAEREDKKRYLLFK